MRYREEIANQIYEETEFEISNNMMIIHVNGELDHHNAVFIREMADKRIFEKGIKNIIFDFDKTEFMDSSGIGVIMGRFKMVSGIGGKIGVVNVRKNVEKILLFSGLNKIISRYENMDKAMNDMIGGKISDEL